MKEEGCHQGEVEGNHSRGDAVHPFVKGNFKRQIQYLNKNRFIHFSIQHRIMYQMSNKHVIIQQHIYVPPSTTATRARLMLLSKVQPTCSYDITILKTSWRLRKFMSSPRLSLLHCRYIRVTKSSLQYKRGFLNAGYNNK